MIEVAVHEFAIIGAVVVGFVAGLIVSSAVKHRYLEALQERAKAQEEYIKALEQALKRHRDGSLERTLQAMVGVEKTGKLHG